jgi:hypothetical protein
MGVLDIDELDLTGMDIDSVGWRGEVIRKSFGGGRGAAARVGSVGGLHRWSLSSGLMPDDTRDLIGSDSRFEYYFSFFKEHTTGDQEVFMLEFRGKKYHAAFADVEVNFERFTDDLFGGGVEIVQRTLDGYVYNADGSLFWPTLDITGLVGWYPILSATDAREIADYSDSNNLLSCVSTPRPTKTTNGGINVIRWDGVDDKPFLSAANVTITHAFLVACATDASFAAFGGLLGGYAVTPLRSENSGTKFADFGYGSSFQYRKNGTDFADNNAQCSMSGVLAVLETEFTSATSLGTQIILGNSDAGTHFWKGDVAYMLLVNNTSLTAAQETQIRQFLAAECGGTITVI